MISIFRRFELVVFRRLSWLALAALLPVQAGAQQPVAPLPDAPRPHHDVVQPFTMGVQLAEKFALNGDSPGSHSTIVGLDLSWRAPGNRVSASTTLGYSGAGFSAMAAVKLRILGFGKAR